MNILYMGYFCNEQVFNHLVENGSHSSHARQQLETKLLTGLIAEKQDDSLEIISYLPQIQEVRKSAGESENYHNIDIKYLWCDKRKPASIINAIFRNRKMIKAWARNKEEKVVITYSVNPIHVIPLLWLRARCHFKVITLCSEVSVFRRTDKTSLVSQISRRISSYFDNSFDGYILLSPYMNEVVNCKQRPYLVMEGIVDGHKEIECNQTCRAILYAGGLTEDNGILILLEGFVEAECLDVELWICGEGVLEEQVKEYANKYNNIHFFGILPNAKVQQMEREAMLLISPRFSKNEFTKYSFPSKTIEYMSTGTPTILTRLAGIPEEYFQYVYVLEDETKQGVAKLIKTILSKSEAERKQLGKIAEQFVMNNKSASAQANKILTFAHSIVYKEENNDY